MAVAAVLLALAGVAVYKSGLWTSPGAVAQAPPAVRTVPVEVGTTERKPAPVFIEAEDGTLYDPQLESFDLSTSTATFQMLAELPNGQYTLHLSGPLGLTDFAGNPLVGNDPSGYYVTSFTVAASERGSAGHPLAWQAALPNGGLDQPQDLGVLFPDELQAGVTITRTMAEATLRSATLKAMPTSHSPLPRGDLQHIQRRRDLPKWISPERRCAATLKARRRY